MDRIKKLSMEVLENHKGDFGVDFVENKKTLEQLSIVRSKGLKNEIAGYITKFLKHELLDKQKQDERVAKQEKLEVEEENLDSVESKTEPQSESTNPAPEETSEVKSEEKPQEIAE